MFNVFASEDVHDLLLLWVELIHGSTAESICVLWRNECVVCINKCSDPCHKCAVDQS